MLEKNIVTDLQQQSKLHYIFHCLLHEKKTRSINSHLFTSLKYQKLIQYLFDYFFYIDIPYEKNHFDFND